MADAETIMKRAAIFLAAIPDAADKATAAALSRASAAGRETAIAGVLGRYAAKGSDVRAAITATSASPENLSAQIIARSGSAPLGYFPHTPSEIGTGGNGKSPLRVEVLLGSVHDVPGAFVAPIGGKPRIMIRTGQKTASGKTQITPLQSVPIAVMMNNDQIRDAVEQRAIDVLETELDKQIDRALTRAS